MYTATFGVSQVEAASRVPDPLLDRVRFIEHSGKRVLLIDSRNCTAEEVRDNYTQCKAFVTNEPPESVLTLSDFTGAQIDRQTFDFVKQVAVFDRPHVRKAALVGKESFPDVFFRGLQSFSARSFQMFDTREQALAWLVEE